MSFQQNLQYLMDFNGLSNYQLAKELECHQSSVANWLEGSKPQKRTMKAIADYFGVTVEALESGEKLKMDKNDQKEKTPTPAKKDGRESSQSKLNDIYFSLAQDLQDAKIDPEDIRNFANIIAKNMKKVEEDHD